MVSLTLTIRYSSLAQQVERVTVNHDATGSSPVRGAIEPGDTVLNLLTAYGIGSGSSDDHTSALGVSYTS